MVAPFTALEPIAMPQITETHRDTLLNETQAADYLGLSVRTLQAWRVRGGGPQYSKLCRAVRYSRDELTNWVAAQSRSHTSQEVA